MERGITPYMRTRDSTLRKNSQLYGPERFTYLPKSNGYLCPAGQQLNYGGRNARNPIHVYIGTRKRCGACAQQRQCTTSPWKYPAIHINDLPGNVREPWPTRLASRTHSGKGRGSEALFAEPKNQIGLRRLRMRRMKFVREQFFLAAGCPKTSSGWSASQSGAPTAARRDGLVSNPCKKLFFVAPTPHQLPLPSSPFSTPTLSEHLKSGHT